MNIDEQWKKLEGTTDEYLSTMLNLSTIKSLPSKDPLVMLKRGVLINTVWAMLTGILYLFVLIRFPFWPLILCFGIVLLFTGWAIFKNILLYRKLTAPYSNKSMLEAMEYYYTLIQKWIRIQEKAFLFIYPVIIVGGCMLGGLLGSGKPLEEVIQNRKVIAVTALAIAIGVPLCYYLAKLANRKAFGHYVEQLKKNISALKENNEEGDEKVVD